MLTHSSLGLCPNVSFPSPHSLPDTSSPFTSGANAWHPSTGVCVLGVDWRAGLRSDSALWPLLACTGLGIKKGLTECLQSPAQACPDLDPSALSSCPGLFPPTQWSLCPSREQEPRAGGLGGGPPPVMAGVDLRTSHTPSQCCTRYVGEGQN